MITTRFAPGRDTMSSYTRGQTITVTAVAAFTTLLIGLAIGRGNLDGIKDWQGSLGALIAIGAATVAVWNVSRQLRMTLVAREETLMDERYAGLREANRLIRSFNLDVEIELDDDPVRKVLERYDLLSDNRDSIAETIETRIPLAQKGTQHSLIYLFWGLNIAFDFIKKGNPLGFTQKERALADLRKQEATITARLKKWDERLPQFRAEIEAYFGR